MFVSDNAAAGGTGRWHKDAELLGTLSESEAKASRDPFAELGTNDNDRLGDCVTGYTDCYWP